VADIPPGPLSRTSAGRLNAHARRVRANQEAAVRILRHPPERSIPVRLTDYDAASNVYSGYEQSYAADGTRYERPGGRTFSPEWSPIYGIGDGADAMLTLPAEATVRFATVTPDRGPVYELDAACKCEQGASGSGDTPFGTVLTCCCPTPISRRLYATPVLTAGTCACLPATFPIDYVPFDHAWSGVAAFCGGSSALVRVGCGITCNWAMSINPTYPFGGSHPFDPCGNEEGALTLTQTAVCSPFSLRLGPFVSDCCPGAVFDWVVTP
jgi:hypothetical protein